MKPDALDCSTDDDKQPKVPMKNYRYPLWTGLIDLGYHPMLIIGNPLEEE